ncbi:MAG: PQQ-binding-like beta-propeller repeat protein [Planctomycetota bacterium]|jgi:hypothetical protein
MKSTLHVRIVLPFSWLLLASVSALGQSPVPSGTAVFTGTDPDAERSLNIVKGLTSRQRWEEAFLTAQSFLAASSGPAKEFLYPDSKHPGVYHGFRESLFGSFLRAPEAIRRRIREMADNHSRSALGQARSCILPETALRVAADHPFASTREEALRLAADRFLETGRITEAGWILHRLARGFGAALRSPGENLPAKDTAGWPKRMAFVLARNEEEPPTGPAALQGIRVLAPAFSLRGPKRVPVRADFLRPTFLPGVFSMGDAIGLSMPQGIALLDPEKRTMVKWAPQGDWAEEGGRRGPGLPIRWPLSKKPLKGRQCLYPVVQGGGTFFAFEGVRILPEEMGTGYRGMPRRLMAFARGKEDGKLRLLWSRYPQRLVDGGKAREVFFHSAPVVKGGRLWIVLALRARSPLLHLACLDPSTGSVRWSRFLCVAPGDARRFRSLRIHVFPPQGELILSDGVLWLQTNVGLILALDPCTGRPLWGFQYERRDWSRYFRFRRVVRMSLGERFPTWPTLGPPLLAGPWRIFAPWDSPLVMAIPKDGGPPIIAWNAAEMGGEKNLSAVVGSFGSLLILGLEDRLIALDGDKGWSPRWTLLGAKATGGKGFVGEPCGRGIVAKDRCLFPTTKGVFLLDCATGTLVEGKTSRAYFGVFSTGMVHLGMAKGKLIAAGQEKVWILDAE